MKRLAVIIALLVALLPASARAQSLYKQINLGGGAITTASGAWEDSAAYLGTGGANNTWASPPTGVNDAVYHDSRQAANGAVGTSFQVLVPVTSAGTYLVELLVIEQFNTAANARLFDVSAEGVLELDNYDTWASVGYQVMGSVSFYSDVSDGELTITVTNAPSSTTNTSAAARVYGLRVFSTPTPTLTPTNTPTNTPTSTLAPTATDTATATNTPTNTATAAASSTPTATPTGIFTCENVSRSSGGAWYSDVNAGLTDAAGMSFRHVSGANVNVLDSPTPFASGSYTFWATVTPASGTLFYTGGKPYIALGGASGAWTVEVCYVTPATPTPTPLPTNTPFVVLVTTTPVPTPTPDGNLVLLVDGQRQSNQLVLGLGALVVVLLTLLFFRVRV